MIRSARLEDVEAIQELWNYASTHTLVNFSTDTHSRADVERMVHERAPAFLVIDGGLGFATYGRFRPGPGYAHTVEHSVHIAREARGLGYGRALMTRLEEVARADGNHAMVGAVSGANPPALAFHKSIGFRVVAKMPEVGRKWGQWRDLYLVQKLIQ